MLEAIDSWTEPPTSSSLRCRRRRRLGFRTACRASPRGSRSISGDGDEGKPRESTEGVLDAVLHDDDGSVAADGVGAGAGGDRRRGGVVSVGVEVRVREVPWVEGARGWVRVQAEPDGYSSCFDSQIVYHHL